jgi:hypothetical protein
MGLENQKFNQKTTEYQQKEKLWVYQKGAVASSATQAFTLNSTTPIYIMQCEIAHDFDAIKPKGQSSNSNTFDILSLPSFIVNLISAPPYVLIIGSWNNGGIYYDNGTNTVHYLKQAFLTGVRNGTYPAILFPQNKLVIRFILKRTAGSLAVASTAYAFNYMLLSPLAKYVAKTQVETGLAAGVGYYYDRFIFDKYNNLTSTVSGVTTSAASDITAVGGNYILSGIWPDL